METSDKERFQAAVSDAINRVRGNHGSVGTQNEKLIHAALKNYYVPFSEDQEIRIGRYFADAVGEDGIYEIQTKKLHALRAKLEVFTSASNVIIVHPVEVKTRNIFINSDTGEIIKETPFHAVNKRLAVYEELYSIRELLKNKKITIILARLVTEKHISGHGAQLPDLRSRSAKKKLEITKIPLELVEETVIPLPDGLRYLIPEGLGEEFTKKDFCKAANEPYSSLRLEVLRAAGLIAQIGKSGRSYLYKLMTADCASSS